MVNTSLQVHMMFNALIWKTPYDVESNGRLLPGVGYPAYVQKISITQTGMEKSFHPPSI